jgi:hypothetical protein
MTRTWIFGVASAAALLLSSALAQEGSQGTASVPDLSGVWGNPYLYGIEPPLSGPGPVVNKSRRRQTVDIDGRRLPPANAPLVSSAIQLVGDYARPILKPAAAEVVKKHAEMSLAGVGYPSPRNQCWPEGVPFIFTNSAVQLLQQPDKITMLYDEDHEVRRVRMNEPHPEQVTPSWYGDSVGHYEGDTLVIDTVGFKIGLFSAVDQYGTPFTQALHVVERYRLIDYEAARAAWERGGKENSRAGQGIGEGWAPDSTNKGKDCNSNSRSKTKKSSQHLGPRPKLIGASSVTGRNKSVQKTHISTVPKKTLRSQLLTSRARGRGRIFHHPAFANLALSEAPTTRTNTPFAMRQSTMANRRYGSDSVIRRCRLQCLLCPKADTAGRFMGTRPNLSLRPPDG